MMSTAGQRHCVPKQRENPYLQFLLVARHGRGADQKDVQEVAQALREALAQLPVSIQISVVRYAGSPETQWAAQALARQLDHVTAMRAEEKLQLGPNHIGPYEVDTTSGRIKAAWEHVESHFTKSPGEALMLVGNAPAVDWFLAGKVDEHVALANAEVACLVRLRPGREEWWFPRRLNPPWRWNRWHLWWLLTPHEGNAIEQLRQKVESKMTVISVLAGFTAAVLATIAVELATTRAVGPDDVANWDGGDRSLLLLSVGALTLSLVLQISALLAYDRLMMPQRFWATTRARSRRRREWHAAGSGRAWERRQAREILRAWPVWRPPSSAGWIIYQHSIRLWRWVVVALILAGVGVLALVLVAVKLFEGWPAAASIVFAALLVAIASRLWLWPRLGTED